jgi:hypothetical protein
MKNQRGILFPVLFPAKRDKNKTFSKNNSTILFKFFIQEQIIEKSIWTIRYIQDVSAARLGH